MAGITPPGTIARVNRPEGDTPLAELAFRLDELGQHLFDLPAPALTLEPRPSTSEQSAYRDFVRKLTYAAWGPSDRPAPGESELTPEQHEAIEALEWEIRRTRLREAAGMLAARGCMDPAVIFIAEGTAWETALEMCALLKVETALAPATP